MHQALQGVERVDALDGLFEGGNHQALQGEPRVAGIDGQKNDREAVQGAACKMRAVGRCAATTRMTARRRKLERNRRAAMTLEPKTFGAGERSLEGWCMEVGRRKVDQKQGNDPRWEVAREWGCEPMIERSWTVVRSSFLGNALSPCGCLPASCSPASYFSSQTSKIFQEHLRIVGLTSAPVQAHWSTLD
jgi:hypothetical protein